MVIMPDNWPLGTRQVSFSGICCLDGGRGERVTRTERQTFSMNQETGAERVGHLSRKRENEDCMTDGNGCEMGF